MYTYVVCGAAVNELQWGRNFIVAEIGWNAVHEPKSNMLQWSRNFIVAEMAPWSR